jgi:hypothetical protein
VTGFRHPSFRHKCSRDGCYIEQLSDWSDIVARLPDNIVPTDIDGFICRHQGHIGRRMFGSFLFLEEKRPNATSRNGQRYALKALSFLPGVTVLIFRPGDAKGWQMMIYHNGKTDGFEDVTREELLDWISAWVAIADRNTKTKS